MTSVISHALVAPSTISVRFHSCNLSFFNLAPNSGTSGKLYKTKDDNDKLYWEVMSFTNHIRAEENVRPD